MGNINKTENKYKPLADYKNYKIDTQVARFMLMEDHFPSNHNLVDSFEEDLNKFQTMSFTDNSFAYLETGCMLIATAKLIIEDNTTLLRKKPTSRKYNEWQSQITNYNDLIKTIRTDLDTHIAS